MLGVLVAVIFLGGDSSTPPPEAATPAVTTPVTGAAPAETTSPAPEAVAPGAAAGVTPFEAGFVVETKSVSKYSRIAEGVDLKRTPAIIVLSPLDVKLSKGETAPLPAATVTYGYRGPESVQQKVDDALYEGKQLGYDPG